VEPPDVELLTSRYALDEAERNLETDEQRARLAAFQTSVRMVEDPELTELPAGITLREKDRPIVAAAVGASASHLLTGDMRDFGPYMGQHVGPVLVQLPGEYLRTRGVTYDGF
jgi:hypothetical protein